MFTELTTALFRRVSAAAVGQAGHSCGSPRRMARLPNSSSGAEPCDSGTSSRATSVKYICFTRAKVLVRAVVVGNRLSGHERG